MKQDVTVSRSGSDRAEIEAQRGIVRDVNGKIILSQEQKDAKIAMLEAKIEDFANRTKNAKRMIKELKAK